MSKLLQRIQEAADLLAAERAEQERVQAEADKDLEMLFGEMAEELGAHIFERKVYIDLGQVTSVVWWVGSEALQLAPARIEWTPKHRARGRENRIDIAIQDGMRGQTWHDVADEQFDEVILLAMRLAYEPWKAAQEKKAEMQIEEAQRVVMLRRSQLCHPNNWHADHSVEYVTARYTELVDMGETALAEEKFSLWRANVAAQAQKAATEERARLERVAAEKDYEVKLDAWREECQVWAETETARLWQPWHVWRVRYVAYDALFSAAAAEEMAPIEVVYTLDEPTDIVNEMRPVALVERVEVDGEVKAGFALATFLDGIRVDYGEPSVTDSLKHHRSYWAGGYVVNVPAFVLEEPVAAPACPKREGEDYTWVDSW